MKNKLIIFFLSYFFLTNFALAETFKFETSNIELIENGNLIYASNGRAISSDGELEIYSDKFEYNELTNDTSNIEETEPIKETIVENLEDSIKDEITIDTLLISESNDDSTEFNELVIEEKNLVEEIAEYIESEEKIIIDSKLLIS